MLMCRIIKFTCFKKYHSAMDHVGLMLSQTEERRVSETSTIQETFARNATRKHRIRTSPETDVTCHGSSAEVQEDVSVVDEVGFLQEVQLLMLLSRILSPVIDTTLFLHCTHLYRPCKFLKTPPLTDCLDF